MPAIARPSRFLRVWFVPTWMMLGWARLVILALPFQAVARWCGRNNGPAGWSPLVAASQRGRARQIRDVIEAAARHAPWRADCFPQALVAAALLRVYGIPYAMYLGVARGENGALRAHAWVDAGGVPVSGGRSFTRFSIVACFVHASP